MFVHALTVSTAVVNFEKRQRHGRPRDCFIISSCCCSRILTNNNRGYALTILVISFLRGNVKRFWRTRILNECIIRMIVSGLVCFYC